MLDTNALSAVSNIAQMMPKRTSCAWLLPYMTVPMALASVFLVFMVGQEPAASLSPQSQPLVRPEFEVISIRRNLGSEEGAFRITLGKIEVDKLPVRQLIRKAYGVQDFQISGGPTWVDLNLYDISVMANDISGDRFPLILQTLLEDRFRLKIHRETKQSPVYELTVAKSGLKMQRTKEGSCQPIDLTKPQSAPTPLCGTSPGPTGPGELRRVGISMTDPPGPPLQGLSGQLSVRLGRPVIDKTGLKEIYDVHLRWTPNPSSSVANGRSILAALREQLGLEITSGTGPVDTLIIDYVEQPSEN
jgi:uncharacterized protein (TIGR03435 family)